MDPITIGLLTGLGMCLAAVSAVLVFALRRIHLPKRERDERALKDMA